MSWRFLAGSKEVLGDALELRWRERFSPIADGFFPRLTLARERTLPLGNKTKDPYSCTEGEFRQTPPILTNAKEQFAKHRRSLILFIERISKRSPIKLQASPNMKCRRWSGRTCDERRDGGVSVSIATEGRDLHP